MTAMIHGCGSPRCLGDLSLDLASGEPSNETSVVYVEMVAKPRDASIGHGAVDRIGDDASPDRCSLNFHGLSQVDPGVSGLW